MNKILLWTISSCSNVQSKQTSYTVVVLPVVENMNIKHETAEECLEDEKNATTDKTTMAWVYGKAHYILERYIIKEDNSNRNIKCHQYFTTCSSCLTIVR